MQSLYKFANEMRWRLMLEGCRQSTHCLPSAPTPNKQISLNRTQIELEIHACDVCYVPNTHTHTGLNNHAEWRHYNEWGGISQCSRSSDTAFIYTTIEYCILLLLWHQLRPSYFMHCILIFFFTDCDLNNRISIELLPLANWSTSIIIHNIEIKLTILHCCLFCCWLHPQKYGTNVALRCTVSVTDQLTNRQNTQIKQWLGLCCCLVLSCCLWPFFVQWPTNVTNDSCWCWLL